MPTYPTSKEEAVLAVTSEVGGRDEDGNDGAVQASAQLSMPKRQASTGVMVWPEWEKESPPSR